ncbi:MAG: glycosyltransferase family 39 protein [Chloroflexota bacterium]|nr:glycosyltransferase family 39 protein [Chloroflexia bacterium]MDQ3227843.1 glycosyltransferase family 39 protein [Chloroflexota bacterium]
MKRTPGPTPASVPLFSRWDALLAGLVFVVALWVNLGAVATTEFHRDEARWVHRARFLGELRHPAGDYWQESELMMGQPPLGSYVMGLGLVLQDRDLDTNGFYNFHYGQDWNRRHGNLPDEADLAAARRTNGVIGALLAASVYLIARGLSNPVAGIAAAALLIPHPLSIYLSSLAGSDALVTLLVAWAALAAMLLAQRPTWPRALLLGILLGLGGAAKLSPLAQTIPLAAAGLVLVIHGWRGSGPGARHDGILGWRLLVQPALAAATFVVVFPYLWPDPIRRTLALFRFRAIEMHNQGVIWSELNVHGPIDALGRIGNWLGEVDSVTGQGVDAVARLFGATWKPMGFDLVLAVIGALMLLALAIQRGLGSRWALAALVLGGQVALVVFGMRADFSRYLLPVLSATAVCGGLVAGAVWDVAWARIARRRGARRPTPEATALAGEPVRS